MIALGLRVSTARYMKLIEGLFVEVIFVFPPRLAATSLTTEPPGVGNRSSLLLKPCGGRVADWEKLRRDRVIGAAAVSVPPLSGE